MDNDHDEIIKNELLKLQMLSVKEVSKLLRLSRSQVFNLIHHGTIKAVRFHIRGKRAKFLIPLRSLKKCIRNNLYKPVDFDSFWSNVHGATLNKKSITDRNPAAILRQSQRE